METAEELKIRYQGYSLRDVYLFHCDKLQVRPNTGLANVLPRQSDALTLIRELDCSTNYISANGFYPFLEVLYASHRLEKLVLRSNGLTNETVEALCKITMYHPSLAVLDLSDNPKLSTPAGNAILRLVQRNSNLRRIDLRGTLIPADVIARIQRHTNKHLAAFSTRDSLAARTAYMERVVYDVLLPQQRALIMQPVRSMRLHESLHVDDVWALRVDAADPNLPPLSSEEKSLLASAFAAYNAAGRNTGFLDHGQVCRMFLTDFGESGVTVDDVDFQRLFKRLDADGDGCLTHAECSVLLRNFLAHEAVTVRNEQLLVLRDSFVISSNGHATLGVEELPELLRTVDRKITPVNPSDPNTISTYAKHDGNRLSEDDFVESFVLFHCLTNPSFQYVYIQKKTFLPALRPTK